MEQPAIVLDFWFSQENKTKWYVKDEKFDKQIETNFAALLEKASLKQLKSWQETPNGSLALIILLDQFSRNIYRNTPKSFVFDKQAIMEAKLAIDKGFDLQVDEDKRAFMYMPFMHSENLQDQEDGIEHFVNVKYAIEHKDIIQRFGRFPHRNKILGRESTKEELYFLENEHSGF